MISSTAHEDDSDPEFTDWFKKLVRISEEKKKLSEAQKNLYEIDQKSEEPWTTELVLVNPVDSESQTTVKNQDAPKNRYSKLFLII